jgi:hypothetical protein
MRQTRRVGLECLQLLKPLLERSGAVGRERKICKLLKRW